MGKGLQDLVAEAKARIAEVSALEARALLEQHPDALVLDVREHPELGAGRLPAALHVPRGVLEPKAAADSPARDRAFDDLERVILTYCASGVRSALAADALQVLGFTEVRSLAGGFAAWSEAGLPVDE